jgi:hypothetical protein
LLNSDGRDDQERHETDLPQSTREIEHVPGERDDDQRREEVDGLLEGEPRRRADRCGQERWHQREYGKRHGVAEQRLRQAVGAL